MIVYNVKRRFFAMKDEAEAYRKFEGLKPDALIKIEITHRDQLAALLNGLCDPPAKGAPKGFPAPSKVIDEAYVQSDFDVPQFIRKSRDDVWAGKLPS